MMAAPCVESMPLSQQVDELLELVFPAAPQFSALPVNARVVLSCAVYDYTRDVILAISKPAVERLAALGAEIDIDYYDMTSTTTRTGSRRL